jgi:predicted YcjX-like family ATPase
MSRVNLKHLLAALTKRASENWERNEVGVSYHVAASVLSTEDGTAVRGDRTVEVVLGRRIGEDKVHPFDVGQVPAAIPPPSFWTAPYFEMPVFRPPIIDASGALAFHIWGWMKYSMRSLETCCDARDPPFLGRAAAARTT